MDAFKSSLAATLAFLTKNEKLDKVSYDAIEGAQVATLLKRLDAIKLELGHASELSELVQNSSLAECHKTSLIKALSASSCKAVSQKGGKRDHQFLLSGFLNYLTQTEKEALRDDSKHAFTRCSIPVARCMKIELFMPCEKTYGHVLATLIEHFQMAGTAKEANDLLVEFKRLLRRARGDKTPSLLHYPDPADPRELPANLFQAAYTNATELDAAQSANCKPGKWLRASSKDLQEMVVPFQGHGSMRAGQMNFMQQQMLMQQHLQQMQLLHQQQQQGDLTGLVVFPKKRKSLDNGNVSSPSGQSGQGGAPLALQDIPVRNSFALPDPGAASSVPSTGSGEAKQETSAAAAADQEVDAHLNAMDDAFNARGDHRAALKRPASNMDQKGKGKGTKKTNQDSCKGKGSKGNPKAKAKSKSNSTKGNPKGSLAKTKRPPPIPQGGHTCFYLQGKIHRSDSSQSWRTFKKAGDRCDTKLAWKGNPKAAWERALDLIEASSKK